MIPLKIYLDNQDFSNFLYRKDVETVKIKEYLLDKIKSGQIVIGYSYVNIAEFLTDYNDEYKQDRINRVSTITELCGKNAFVFINKVTSKENVLSVEGDWSPDIDVLGYLMKGVNNYINSILRDGKHRSADALKQQIRSSGQLYNSNLSNFSDFPIPESFKKTNIFMSYVCGLVPEQHMRRKVKLFLNDLNIFREIWFEYGEKSNYLHNSLNVISRAYIAVIPVFEKTLKQVKEQRNKLKSLKDSYKHILNQKINDSISEFETTLDNIESLDISILRSHPDFKLYLEDIPDNYLISVISYIKGKAKMKTEIKPGDYADLLHSIYLPYVDLWRCDKACFEILKRGNVPFAERMVKNLSDLPQAIENKLKSISE